MLIDEVKAALEKHRAWWDANGNWVGSGDTTTLEDLAEQMARKLIAAEELAEELGQVLQNGCEVCHGDCASANPPVIGCPMQRRETALAAYRKAGEAYAD